mmetsp:Transcript_8551/g.9647  ORF Transcript_8551/g.9647 Transcript_8551/m.9647 type:complete len:103 (+) Transcript_8551:113-421(+)
MRKCSRDQLDNQSINQSMKPESNEGHFFPPVFFALPTCCSLTSSILVRVGENTDKPVVFRCPRCHGHQFHRLLHVTNNSSFIRQVAIPHCSQQCILGHCAIR